MRLRALRRRYKILLTCLVVALLILIGSFISVRFVPPGQTLLFVQMGTSALQIQKPIVGFGQLIHFTNYSYPMIILSPQCNFIGLHHDQIIEFLDVRFSFMSC